MSQGDQEINQDLPRRLEGFANIAKLIGALGGAAVVIWGIIGLFIPIGDVDLTVWIQQEIPIILPELPTAADELSLSLIYDGEPIGSATVLDVNIFNSGSKPIGEKDSWQLTLRTENGARFVLLGEPKTKPVNLQVQVADDFPSEALKLELGLFNPDDSIGLRLLVIEPENADHPAIAADTRVPNLKLPFVTRDPELHRLRDAFIPPLFFLSFAAGIGIAVWGEKKEGWPSFKNEKTIVIISSGLLYLLSLIFVSAIVAGGLAWALSVVALFVIGG